MPHRIGASLYVAQASPKVKTDMLSSDVVTINGTIFPSTMANGAILIIITRTVFIPIAV
jgi:hypothetical protein